MAMEDIRDQLKEQFAGVFARIRESSAYAELSEKYQGLSPVAQKLSLIGAVLVGFLIVMAIPWSIFSSSSDLILQYDDKRALVQDVYHVSRAANAVGARNVSPVNAGEFQSRAQMVVNESALQPEQIVSVSPIPEAKVPGIATTIGQAGVEVTLKKLNLTQVVDIGHKLQTLDPERGRMIGIDIKANAGDRHYFDVVYRVIGFGPKPDGAGAGAGGARGTGRNRRGS